ncbi:MAG: hypothetical protein FWG45_06620 [Oscillospiraceae bacterium]|nr:hypothetical protein [Oscillospiraceae bacterium]
MKDFWILLERAAIDGCSVEVKTKGRGCVVGNFVHVDEFEADPERLGYYLSLGNGRGDVVFEDEIVDVRAIPKADMIRQAV